MYLGKAEKVKHLIKEGFIDMVCSIFIWFIILYIFSGWIIDESAGDFINLFSPSLTLRNHGIKEKIQIEVLYYLLDKVDG